MITLTVLLLLALAGPADVETVAAEFRELRQVRGHFQGGEWCRDVDAWGGRKHRAMEALRQALGQPGTPLARVLSLMGTPEVRMGEPGPSLPESEALLWRLAAPVSGEELLIYEWRGRHDFLYFWIRDGQVSRCDWWMALE